MLDVLDLHTHTIASGHAYNSLYEMAAAAHRRGLSLYGCSEHAPSIPGACNSIYFMNFRVIPRIIHQVPVMMGSELNIIDFDGGLDLEEDILKKLDYAIASLHTPCIDNNGSVADYTNAYLGAIKNPYVHIIGHPDDSRLPADWDTVAAAASEHHVLLEVNNSSLAPASSRQGARENYRQLLTACIRYKTSIIINSDAHCEVDVGNHRQAHELLESMDFPQELVVNTSLEKAAAYLPKLAELLKELPGMQEASANHD